MTVERGIEVKRKKGDEVREEGGLRDLASKRTANAALIYKTKIISLSIKLLLLIVVPKWFCFYPAVYM